MNVRSICEFEAQVVISIISLLYEQLTPRGIELIPETVLTRSGYSTRGNVTVYFRCAESHPGPHVVLRVQRRREPSDQDDEHRAGAARHPHQQREPDGGHDENGRQSVVRPGQVRSDSQQNTVGTVRR